MQADCDDHCIPEIDRPAGCCMRNDDIPTDESEVEQQYWYDIHPQKGWTFLGRIRPALRGWHCCPVNQSSCAVLPARRLPPESPRSAFISYDHALLRSRNHWVSNAEAYMTLMQRELHPLWSWFPYEEPPRAWCARPRAVFLE